MYTLLSATLGILMKVYDDSIDSTLHLSDLELEYIKTFILVIFTLLSVNDFHFSFVVCIGFLGNYFVGGLDTPFWKSFAAVSFFISALSIESMAFTPLILFCYVGFLVAVIAEPLLIPEESSRRKTISRVIMCGIVLGMKAIPMFNNILFFNKLLTFIVSYFGTSLVLNYYTTKILKK